MFSRSLNCCLSPVGVNQYPVSWSEVRRLGTLSKMRLLGMRLDRKRPGLFFLPFTFVYGQKQQHKKKKKTELQTCQGQVRLNFSTLSSIVYTISRNIVSGTIKVTTLCLSLYIQSLGFMHCSNCSYRDEGELMNKKHKLIPKLRSSH